ncbi:MAG: ROK family glucokinase [Lachnospiraceae bacterium]|nr:ROK family glucokinase [Lachnospiraceae bacterium]
MDRYCFGVDLGGTTVKMGLFKPDGELVDKWEIPTVKDDGGSKILPDIANSILAKMDEKNIEKEAVIGVGIGVPGPVDPDGFCNKAANLGWVDKIDLEGDMHELTGLHVKGGNDANVAALGEAWKGGAEGYSDVVVVTLGTGVGGGIIVQGKVLAGSTGAGGEIGHIHIVDNEPEACGCGNHGCLEQYGSATGIVRLANRRLAEDNAPSVLRDGDISAKSVFDAVKAGDVVAIEIAERFGEYLGKGLANVACVTNPQIFVIGGGVSKAGDVLIPYIQKNYVKYVFHASRDAKFALAKLGNDAGIYGSAKLVLE